MSGSQNRKMPFALQPHPAAAPPVDSGSSGSGLRTAPSVPPATSYAPALDQPHLGIPDELRARRKPYPLPRYDGSPQMRFADRQNAAPPPQPPPR